MCGMIGEVVQLVKYAWIKACDHPDQQARKRMGIYVVAC